MSPANVVLLSLAALSAAFALPVLVSSLSFSGSLATTRRYIVAPSVALDGSCPGSTGLLRNYDSYTFEVERAGTYTLTPRAAVEVFAYFYESPFDPHDPVHNCVAQATNVGMGFPGSLSRSLQPDTIYTVVIVANNNGASGTGETGHYTIDVDGPHTSA